MQRKQFLHGYALLISLVLVFASFIGCSSGSSADPVTVNDTPDTPVATPPATSPSQIIGIYSGTYDGQSADFICTGSDCLITVAGKSYAKGVFTNLQSPSASVRAVTFTANLKILEKVNVDGLLCPVSTGETLAFVFPAAGSTDPIKLTVNGVTTDLSEAVVYVVTFDRKNNVKAYVPVKAGTNLNLSDPIYRDIAKGNFSLMDWCLDEACTQVAPNPLPITGNITLYAKWVMTNVAAPVVTDVDDGISIPVTSMPAETYGLQLFRVNADGSWTSLYYRNGYEKDFTRPIHYPFVTAAKACRYVMQYYDKKGYVQAISDLFTVIPAHGVGELSVSNGDDLTIHIADGKISMGAVPVFSGAGASSIVDSKGDFEIFKGNGFASESWEYITTIEKELADTITKFDMMPLPAGTNFFVHFVLHVTYGGDSDYRVYERESDVSTYVPQNRWIVSPATNARIEYTLEDTQTGVKITVTKNPTNEDVQLMYYCDEAKGKSCTFSIMVMNCTSEKQEVDGDLQTNTQYIGSTIELPPEEMGTLVINEKEKVVTDNPMLIVPVGSGCFEIYDPEVTENH